VTNDAAEAVLRPHTYLHLDQSLKKTVADNSCVLLEPNLGADYFGGRVAAAAEADIPKPWA